MNKILVIIFISVLMLIGVTACQPAESEKRLESPNRYESGTRGKNYIELINVSENTWLHKSFVEYEGRQVSANGLVINTTSGLILVDTPWTTEQTRELMKLTKDVFSKDFKKAIVCHAHDDTIGGIDVLIEENIDVLGIELTVKESKKNGFNPPNVIIDNEYDFTEGDTKVTVYYPGQGHAPDNIVVWLPTDKVLFGGCLIKSKESKGLGSIKDANVSEWPKSVTKVLERYVEVKHVVPGHGQVGDKALIEHTLQLLEADS